MLYRVTLKGHAGDVATANVLYFTGASNSAQALCTEISGNWCQYMQPGMASNCNFSSITAVQVEHLVLDPNYYQLTVSIAGTNSTNPHTDPQLAACFSLHTGLSGRTRRGRFFMWGVVDDNVVDGKLTAGAQTAIGGIATNLAGRYVGASPPSGYILQVFSRKIYGGIQDLWSDAAKPVTSITVNPVMSTMRTRKPTA